MRHDWEEELARDRELEEEMDVEWDGEGEVNPRTRWLENDGLEKGGSGEKMESKKMNKRESAQKVVGLVWEGT